MNNSLMKCIIACIIGIVLVVNFTNAQITVPKKLNNVKGDKHVKVRGTNVYIIPPDNASESNSFQGFYDFNTTTTLTVSQRETPLQEAIKDYSNDKLISKQRIKVNNYEGLYLTMRDGNEYMNDILLFGNDLVTVILIGKYNKDNSAMEKWLATSIFSVVLLDEKIPEPWDNAQFKINIENTNLKFARLINGMLIYNSSGQMFSPSSISFVVAFNYGLIAGKLDEQNTALNYLVNELYYKNVLVKESSPIEIDGISGYEITAEGTQVKTNSIDLMYLVMLFNKKNGSYMMFGTTSDDFDKNLVMFKQVSRTFHLK